VQQEYSLTLGDVNLPDSLFPTQTEGMFSQIQSTEYGNTNYTEGEFSFTRGHKQYELSNHLGNVLVTIQDRKWGRQNAPQTNCDYYLSYVVTITDYHAFGSTITERSASFGGGYRFGFNNQEKESELGDYYAFEYRIHDARLGRWLSVDPLYMKYPSYSPFICVLNSPLIFIDNDGREVIKPKTIIKYDGPEVPKCMGEIAITKWDGNFSISKRGTIDFTLQTSVVYSSSFEKIAKKNGGEYFSEWVRIHEEEHLLRCFQVAESDFDFQTELNGKSISLKGRIDAIAQQLYDISVKPQIQIVRSEKYAKLDEFQKAFNERFKDVDMLSVEYKNALADYKNEREKIIEEYENNIYRMQYDFLEKFQKEAKPIIERKMAEFNIHEGENGVNAVSLMKMSEKAAEYDQFIIYNQNGKELENCPKDQKH